jgi:HD-GYP domain-containing protein (c-di-GMP phosphodiesterase class II)/signal transduction histidine kinase
MCILREIAYNSAMDNRELFEKKFSIIEEISNAVVVSDNISAVTNLMLDLAINYTGAEKGSLMMANERDELSILAARGLDLHKLSSYRVKIGTGIVGTVAKSKEAFLVEDIEQDGRFRGKTRDRYKTRSFISCPIIIKSKLIGVININDKQDGRPFTNDDLSLLKVIANQAAVVLDNAGLMNQLKEKAAELSDINNRLIETDVVKTEFITRVSHEFRTPLNAIQGSVYYIQQHEARVNPELREFFNIIATETAKLNTTVENLLDFLRLESEARLLKEGVFGIGDVITEAANMEFLKTLFMRRRAHLVIELPATLPDIVGDRIKVMEMFMNLLEGLGQHLEQGETMRVAAREREHLEIEVNLPRRLKNVLTFRFDPQDIFLGRQQEARLKLYIAKKIVDVHKWDLRTTAARDTLTITITIVKSKWQQTQAYINSAMELLVEFVSEMLDLDICSVMVSDEITGDLTLRSARGLDDTLAKQTRVRIGDSIAGWVAVEGKPLLVSDIESDPRFRRKSISQYNTKSLVSLPLKVRDQVIGVLNLNNKKVAEPFTRIDMDIASVASQRVMQFVEKLYAGEHSEEENRRFLAELEQVVQAEKKYHKKDRISSELMDVLLERIGVSEDERKLGLYITKIYDLGLVLLDNDVLSKKSLRPAEMKSIRIHPNSAVSLLGDIEFSDEVKEVILHHHERYDGTGYPDGLQGKAIPLLSRVLAVVDGFCSLIKDRPYRPALSREAALREICVESGSKYDPAVVAMLESVIGLPRAAT